MKQITRSAAVVVLAAAAVAAPLLAHAGKLEDVKQRGVLRCGILANSAGQSVLDDKGKWHGFSIDYCRGLAAAVFNDPDKVEFRAAAFGQQIASLKSGELDVLAATLTQTMSREVALGFSFVGPTIFSGLTFMVPKSANVSTIKGLDGATICLQGGSLGEEIVPQYMKSRGLTFTALPVATLQQVYANYDNKRCDAVTTDRMTLEAHRLQRPVPAANVVLKETYAKSDTGPVVRSSDVAWFNVARYVHYAMVTAEELGITQANVEQMRSSTNNDVRRFLGVEGKLGAELGLRNDWTVAVIAATGNYGEAWERNLGRGSPLQLTRDANRLARDGGLLTAPVWR